MNRDFRHIWSKALGRVIIVPECARGGGRKSGRRGLVAKRLWETVLQAGTVFLATDASFADNITTDTTLTNSSYSPELHIGGNGVNVTATLQAGDDAASPNVYIGSQPADIGTLIVAGSGTTFTVSSHMRPGFEGNGTLQVLDGAVVSNSDGYVGFYSNSVGTVVVDGAGSHWDSSGGVDIGLYGAGSVLVRNGGELSADVQIDIAQEPGSTGSLAVGAASQDAAAAAGTLSTPLIAFGNGTGQIVFNHTDSAYVFAPSISGAGSVLVENGTTILSGDNSYSGGTTISEGTLVGDTTSLQGDIANDAALVFDQGTDGTYSGALSGAGIFTKQGEGNLTFSGYSADFTGATNISDGTLIVSGTLGNDSGGANDSSLTVDSGGTLSIGTSRNVNAASITNESGGTINLGMEATLRGTGNTLNNSGVINVDDQGLITDAGAINNLAGGVINFLGEAIVTADDDRNGSEIVTNQGTINLFGEKTQTVGFGGRDGDDLVNQGNGQININDGRLYVGDELVNSSPGTAVGGSGGLYIGTAGEVFAAGGILNNAGGEITNAGSLFGEVNNGAGATLTSTGRIVGGRVLENRGTTNAEGTIAHYIINRDAGVFTVTGDLDVSNAFDVRNTSMLNVTGGNLTIGNRLGNQSTASTGVTIATGRTLSADRVENGDTTVNAVLLNNGTLRATAPFETDPAIENVGTIHNNGTIFGDVRNWRSLTNTGTLIDGLVVEDDGINTSIVTNTGTINGPIDVLGGTFITHAEGQAGDISNQGSLVFDQAANGTYAGIISGSGALTKQGEGALTLTRDSSSFAGTTTVLSGELVVNGALGGILNMNGGTLGGSGSLGNVILERGARLTPGNSIGTMDVVNYTFNPGSTYEVELDDGGYIAGTNNDLLNATGTVTINGGTVHVTPENGTDDGSTYTPGTYTIITAATGVAGAGFDAVVTDDYAFLDFILDYSTANQVDLTSAVSLTGFCVPGMSVNQCAAGDGAFSMGAGNSVYDAVLTLSSAEAPVALDQLSGEIHASARTVLLDDSRFLRDAAMDRLRIALGGTAANDSAQIDNPISESFGLWGQGFGSWSQQGGNGNASGLDRSIGGFLMGGDALVWDNFRLGVLGGYSRSGFSTGNLLSTGTADTYTLGVYGGETWDAFALSGGLVHSWHSLDMSRSVAFTGFSDNLSVAYSARTLQAWVEAAYSFEAAVSRFEPFANLAYVTLSTDSFTETGGAAALTSASNVVDATFATLGVRAETDVALGNMSAMVGWRHAFGGAPTAQRTFASGGNAFTIEGAPLAQDSLLLNAGIDIDLTANAALGIAYSGQFSSGVQDHSATINLSVRF